MDTITMINLIIANIALMKSKIRYTRDTVS